MATSSCSISSGGPTRSSLAPSGRVTAPPIRANSGARRGMPPSHDLVLRGGRVLDPETGLDRSTTSASADGRSSRSATRSTARRRSTSPGSSSRLASSTCTATRRRLPGRRLQACDGVTTALELEAGPRAGRARVRARGAAGFADPLRLLGVVGRGAHARGRRRRARRRHRARSSAGWWAPSGSRPRATAQLARILDQIANDLAAGAIGIGILIGYTPGVDPAEYLAVAQLASSAGVPTFTHSRDIVELAPETLIDGAEELVRAAGTTGAHMHYCHINSTSSRHIDRVLALVGAVPVGGQPRHHRGVSLRIGLDRDRRRVPRAGAGARTFPRHRARSPTSRPESASPTRPACASCARPTRAASSSPSSSTKPIPTTSRCCDARSPFPTRSSRATRCRRCGRGAARPNLARVAAAARGRHPSAHGGHVLARASPLAGRGHVAHRGDPARDAASRAGARGRRPRDAHQGSSAARRRRRSRRVRRGTHHRSGDVRREHAPVVGHRARDRRRDLRRARRRARAGRITGRPIRAEPA